MARKKAETVASQQQIRIDREIGEQFRKFCNNSGRKLCATATIALREFLERNT